MVAAENHFTSKAENQLLAQYTQRTVRGDFISEKRLVFIGRCIVINACIERIILYYWLEMSFVQSRAVVNKQFWDNIVYGLISVLL